MKETNFWGAKGKLGIIIQARDGGEFTWGGVTVGTESRVDITLRRTCFSWTRRTRDVWGEMLHLSLAWMI